MPLPRLDTQAHSLFHGFLSRAQGLLGNVVLSGGGSKSHGGAIAPATPTPQHTHITHTQVITECKNCSYRTNADILKDN